MTIYYLFRREDKKEKLYNEYQKKIETVTQVERYGRLRLLYGPYTAVISAQKYGPIIMKVQYVYGCILCRITVPKITRKYGPFTAPYEANSR
jgi:hypothetical protein